MYNMLGLASRAGKCVFGTEAFLKALRAKKVSLAVLSGDASDNTKKKVRNSCEYYKIKLIELNKDDLLGQSVGKPGIKVAGIIDEKMSKAILDKIKD